MPTSASQTSERARHWRATATAILLLGTIVASCLAGEVVVRAMIRRDVDGQEWLRDVRLRPYRLPLSRIGATLASLGTADAFLAYDADLGWVPRPHARSTDGRRRVDAGGIRTDRETQLTAAEGVLRIALFGDSFTFGDEIAQDETWGVALERALARRGVAAEVLNFGVNAYGMDQAFLRWRRDGRRYAPKVVILGFHPENALRNVNVFRPLYFAGSDAPLSKPRFVDRGGTLVAMNVPTIPPERLLTTLAALEAEPLLAYERYFGPYARHWWMASKTAALVATMADAHRNPFVSNAEVHDIAVGITASFANEAQADGASFAVVHLPGREDLATLRAGQQPWYDALLRDLRARHPVWDPVPPDAAADDAMFAPHGHYAAPLGQMLGAALAEPVLRAAGRR